MLHVFDLKPECLELITLFSKIVDLQYLTRIWRKKHYVGKYLDISNKILSHMAKSWPGSVILSSKCLFWTHINIQPQFKL